jgi:hypothetical protein
MIKANARLQIWCIFVSKICDSLSFTASPSSAA